MDYGIKGRTTGQVRAEMARIIRAQNPALTAKPFVPGYPVIRPYLITSDPMVSTFAAEDVIRWLLSYKLGAVRTKEKSTASGITIAFMTKEESEQMLRADVGLGLEQPHRLVCVAQIQGVCSPPSQCQLSQVHHTTAQFPTAATSSMAKPQPSLPVRGTRGIAQVTTQKVPERVKSRGLFVVRTRGLSPVYCLVEYFPLSKIPF